MSVQVVCSDTARGTNYLRKEGAALAWVYEARLYDSKSVASYVAMCVRDDHLLRGIHSVKVQVFRTKKGNYGVRYRHSTAAQ
jgi:hypothetical protein